MFKVKCIATNKVYDVFGVKVDERLTNTLFLVYAESAHDWRWMFARFFEPYTDAK